MGYSLNYTCPNLLYGDSLKAMMLRGGAQPGASSPRELEGAQSCEDQEDQSLQDRVQERSILQTTQRFSEDSPWNIQLNIDHHMCVKESSKAS